MALTRRQLLAGVGATAAATALPARADAAVERPAIVLIYLQGGYHALFSAADAYVASHLYDCTEATVRDLGNGLVVDKDTLGALPPAVLGRMATVGVNHRASGHDFALKYAWFDGADSVPLKLAEALGGTSAFRCVHFGNSPGDVPHRAYRGISMTSVPDLSAPVTLYSAADSGPRRDLVARALKTSLDYGTRRFARSPTSLSHTWEGTNTLIASLTRPPPSGIDWPAISAAYGLPAGDLSARSFASQLAGAELMLRAGTDVVCVTSKVVTIGATNHDWDTHGDSTGSESREMMKAVLPSLSTFLGRTLAMPGRNVVTLLWGDFARLGGKAGVESGHGNGVSASVFGKYVRPGTTGRFATNATDMLYQLPKDTPEYPGLWALLTSLAKCPSSPWGDNPHRSLVNAS